MTKPAPSILEPFIAMPNGGAAPRCQFVRTTNEQCLKAAMKGARCCRTHGGSNAARVGPLNPNWKGGITPHRKGRWQSLLPALLREQYANGLDDPKLLSLPSEVALVDVRIGAKLDELKEGARWADARAGFERLTAGMSAGDTTEIHAGLTALRDAIDTTEHNDRVWNHVLKLIERRRRLCDTERRAAVREAGAMSRADALRFAAAMLETVTRHCTDASMLKAIAEDLRVLLVGTEVPTIH